MMKLWLFGNLDTHLGNGSKMDINANLPAKHHGQFMTTIWCKPIVKHHNENPSDNLVSTFIILCGGIKKFFHYIERNEIEYNFKRFSLDDVIRRILQTI